MLQLIGPAIAASIEENWRTLRQITATWPPADVSASRRSYRLCTRRYTEPQAGQAAREPLVLAWIRTRRPATNTRSTDTPARFGSKTRQSQERTASMITKSMITMPPDTPRPATSRKSCQSLKNDPVSSLELRPPDMLSWLIRAGGEGCSQ
jgi:hypothetical protein